MIAVYLIDAAMVGGVLYAAGFAWSKWIETKREMRRRGR